ncbi:MAG: hypothetical protein AB7O43_03570 [Hyphomicrobiaceae bacterium]
MAQDRLSTEQQGGLAADVRRKDGETEPATGAERATAKEILPKPGLAPPVPISKSAGDAAKSPLDSQFKSVNPGRVRLPPAVPFVASAGGGGPTAGNAALKVEETAEAAAAGDMAPAVRPDGAPDGGAADAAEGKGPANRAMPPAPPELPGAAQSAGSPPLSQRRNSHRRAAAPSRDQIAANDDAPSIGGLIYALNQKPSSKPFSIAAGISGGWVFATIVFAIYQWGGSAIEGGFGSLAGRPEILMLVATLLGPVGLAFGLALIAYRAEEMRLRSSAMTEVAVRLAEPDRMAEQSVASLGQAVRRQVSFMNDAVGRALGRASELEALVHNEVSALERSYEENERKIRGLIQELSGERDALVNTSERVSDSLKSLGTEVPDLIEKLSGQQVKLARIIEGAGQNLTALESAIATQTGNLENALGSRTEHLQSVLTEYTTSLSGALDGHMQSIGATIASRTGELQVVFEEYTRALDTTMDNRAQALDTQLVERTRALDAAFTERLKLFDESIVRSAYAIDSSINEKTEALSSALENHARNLNETLSRQSIELDENLLQGISAVRRTSENITRQSIKAIEGLAGQSELLKSVSENLLNQINGITNRFETQGQQILRSANALESANYKIDQTLQTRHAELSQTLDRMIGKADELGTVAHGYSRQLEGTMSQAEQQARLLTAELAQSAQERSRSTIADIERLREEAAESTSRALEDLRSRFTNVTQEVSVSLGSMTDQFSQTSSEARRKAAQAAADLASEQERLRASAQSLPGTARESAEAVRKVLQDQLRALDELSSISQREARARDVSRPTAPRPLVPVATQATREEQTRTLSALSNALSEEMRTRGGRPSAAQAGPGDGRDGWSLGDLLKRASADEAAASGADAGSAAAPQAAAPAPARDARLDIGAMARALDPSTAAEIWQRLGSGQRGIMVRSIYTLDGRALFDQTAQRLSTDAAYASNVNQFLTHFEQVLQESERQDPSGQMAQGHLVSDYGRVYLFLAHLTGRIT